MSLRTVLLATAACLVSAPALADSAETATSEKHSAAKSTPAAKPAAFNTGVAKGRDLLDTAISASTLDEADLAKLGTTAVAGIIGNLPGIRAETSGIDGFSSLTVRGLPLAADGSKFMQIEEDGLPVMEFGDIHFTSADQFVRADIGLSQVQAIRGGSASTFASNSPGGVINLISKTGEEEGGAIQLAAGLDHDLKRVDFEYGAPLGGGWRFHVGGFYRDGEGPRHVGYSAFRGGQLKFNVTRQFANGFVRIYGKYLDDRQPNYSFFPVAIGGTNASPTFASVPGTDVLKDGAQSQYTSSYPGVDQANRPDLVNGREGIRGIVKSIGVEAQFDVGEWTISDKFRFSSIGGGYNEAIPFITAPAGALSVMIGGPGAVLRYASGPNTGQVITSPSTLSGNGLLNVGLHINTTVNNADNVTNDARASRVWPLGNGKLTTTAGIYTSSQNLDTFWRFTQDLETVASGGSATRVDLITAGGVPVTDGGLLAYGFGIAVPLTSYHRRYDLQYRVTAPYASANYQVGKLSIGGSLRFDHGNVKGQLFGVDLDGGRVGTGTLDLNGNGAISLAETKVALLPLSQPGNVDYSYNYTSYSVGANYRVAEPFSVFARYSRGGRAGAERLLFGPALNSSSGKLNDPSVAYSPVKQAEVGLKFRSNGLTAYVTGFWASTKDKNFQIGADATGQVIVINVDRTYSAKGVELEADYQHGPFSLALGATYAKSKIDKDTNDPTLDGNTPRHQPSLFFTARPQYEQDLFTVGATINGTTSTYAQDSDILKQPGYVLVSPYLFVRPVPRVQLGLTAFNVFNKLAFVNLSSAAIPASGIINAQTLNGRTISASLRFTF
ncbi:TonB-dependent receptor [Novosphingobium sp. FKTRR1]|uniref:TonB-dependent receptor n=1 Tax=Novosphingobium sp. FKTRR1 TaxID=2879118 RepID=UPI001CF07E9F|nr:TonB-dependent receptor [Novosphingobium sp. FKTRR1]